jgi:hypothetical protein
LNILVKVSEIERMGVVDMLQFLFMTIEFGVCTLRVIFAMVGVQVGVDNQVNVLWPQTISVQALFKGIDPSADSLFPVWGLDRVHLSCIDQDVLLSSLYVPSIDGDGVSLPISALIGHHALIEDLGTIYNRVNAVRHLKPPYLGALGAPGGSFACGLKISNKRAQAQIPLLESRD